MIRQQSNPKGTTAMNDAPIPSQQPQRTTQGADPVDFVGDWPPPEYLKEPRIPPHKGSYQQPNHGVGLLVAGIICMILFVNALGHRSFFEGGHVLLGVLVIPAAIIWYIASKDMRKIRRGTMRYEGHELVRAGRLLAIIVFWPAAIFAAIYIVVGIILGIFSIINLINLWFR
jgi:hypothetical protein